MSIHPLISLSADRQVKQAKGFREAAGELSGATLEPMYKEESANAPHRHDDGKKYLGVNTIRKPAARQKGKDGKHLCFAVSNTVSAGGASLTLPDGPEVTLVDGLVPLRTAAPDKAKGDADPNKGVEDIGMLGILPDNRICVMVVKYLTPDATHSGAGDTPLSLLLEGLAQAAMVDGNRAALREEIEAATGRTTSEEAPVVALIASPRYWEICRKREAQKGAAWIREMERLAREIPEQIGNEIFYAAIANEIDPLWNYEQDGPVLAEPIQLKDAWESTAGRVKPKRKKAQAAVEIIEPNYDKPAQDYSIYGSFDVGDRISHKTLGEGVCQGTAGVGKVKVLFGEETKILIHERASAGA